MIPAGVVMANKAARTGWSSGGLAGVGLGAGKPAMRMPSDMPSKSWWKMMATTSDTTRSDNQSVQSPNEPRIESEY